MPALFVAVKSLPKDAIVEKQVLWHTGRCLIKEDDEDEPSLQFRVPVTDQGNQASILIKFFC